MKRNANIGEGIYDLRISLRYVYVYVYHVRFHTMPYHTISFMSPNSAINNTVTT